MLFLIGLFSIPFSLIFIFLGLLVHERDLKKLEEHVSNLESRIRSLKIELDSLKK